MPDTIIKTVYSHPDGGCIFYGNVVGDGERWPPC